MNDDDSNAADDQLISKSQLKREAAELTQLGKDLVALQAAHLEKMPLDSDLKRAIEEAQRIKAHIALKRQQQYIGKLLRNRDVIDIKTALEEIRLQSARSNVIFRQTEMWRTKLLADESATLKDFIQQWPTVDKQKLRQLIRNANKEAAAGKPPKKARELFRLIRETLESPKCDQ